jgi:hypothetical protein
MASALLAGIPFCGIAYHPVVSAEATEEVEPVLGLETLPPSASLKADEILLEETLAEEVTLAEEATLLEDETLMEDEALVVVDALMDEEALLDDDTLLDELALLDEMTLLEDEIFATLEEVALFWMIAE